MCGESMKELENFCQDINEVRISYCGNYKTKNCPLSCMYAVKTEEELRLYNINKLLHSPSKSKLKFWMNGE